MWSRAFGIGVMFLSCAAQVFAQEPSVMLKPNTQVRVWQAANGFTRKEGRVASQHGDTLSVRMMMRAALSSEWHSEVITIALSDLDRLEVGFPQPGSVGKGLRRGALRGAAVGGGLGVLLGLWPSECEGSFAPCAGPGLALIAGVSLGALGAMSGAIVGAAAGASRSTRWVPVLLPHRQSR